MSKFECPLHIHTFLSLNVPTFTSLFLRYMCITLLLPLLLPLIYFICHSNISICAGQHSKRTAISVLVLCVCERRQRTKRTNRTIRAFVIRCEMVSVYLLLFQAIFFLLSLLLLLLLLLCCVFFFFRFILVIRDFLLKSMSVRIKRHEIYVYLWVMLPIFATDEEDEKQKQNHTYILQLNDNIPFTEMIDLFLYQWLLLFIVVLVKFIQLNVHSFWTINIKLRSRRSSFSYIIKEIILLSSHFFSNTLYADSLDFVSHFVFPQFRLNAAAPSTN